MPLANATLSADELRETEPLYPLAIAFCPECFLVQITETVPPQQLFDNYLYFSAYSQTMLHESKLLADRLIESHNLNSGSLVVELGSNDGYQLQYFVAKQIPVLGIDPAKNVAEVAKAKGIPTLCDYFGKNLALELRDKNQLADIIIAKNVLAHVPDLDGFVEGIGSLLKKNGMAIVEVPYLKDIIDKCEFDTIYHEHLSYFSVTSLNQLFRSHGMVLLDIERIPLHGGSLRLSITHDGRQRESVQLLLEDEREWGVGFLETYLNFASKVENVKNTLRSLLASIKKDGRSIAAYGAAAKGTVLLNYCGIGLDILDFVVDLSPHKQGRYIPGVRVPIYPPKRLLEAMPDYTLMLAWNIAGEIFNQQGEYRRRGGKFIIPLPKPEIVGEQ
jgi:SAM-dependent methyltransferase